MRAQHSRGISHYETGLQESPSLKSKSEREEETCPEKFVAWYVFTWYLSLRIVHTNSWSNDATTGVNSAEEVGFEPVDNNAAVSWIRNHRNFVETHVKPYLFESLLNTYSSALRVSLYICFRRRRAGFVFLLYTCCHNCSILQ